MLIELRGTEFNRRTNLFCGLGRFNRGLALIGFRTTGAWSSKGKNQIDVFIQVMINTWAPVVRKPIKK